MFMVWPSSVSAITAQIGAPFSRSVVVRTSTSPSRRFDSVAAARATKARMAAAVSMDAQNAPTATWKTAQHAVSHSAHTHHRWSGKEDRRKTQRSNGPTHEIPDSPGPRQYLLTALGSVASSPTDQLYGSHH